MSAGFLLLFTTLAHETPPLPMLEAGIFSAKPSALSTGHLLGPSVGLRYRLDDLAFAIRSQVGFASENDLYWEIEHTEIRPAFIAEYMRAFGRGELGFRMGLGAFFLLEHRTRHQADRLTQSSIEFETRGSSFGSMIFCELVLGLILSEPWAISLAGGPILSAPLLPEPKETRVGWNFALSVVYAFGEDEP